VEKATVIKENSMTYNVDKDDWEGIDLTQFSDEELAALGIDPSEVDRGDPVDDDDETDDEDIEETDDEDEDDSDESEDDEEEDSEETQKDIRIPKARFDEAVRKERERAKALEERTAYLEGILDKLLAQQAKPEEPPAPKFDFDEAEENYEQAIFNGELDKARQIRREINKAQEARIQELLTQVEKKAESKTAQLTEQQEFNVAIRSALTKYPFLDDKHETYNEEVVQEINALAAGYKSTLGLSSAEALNKAVNKIAAPLAKTSKTSSETIKKRTEKASKIAKEPPKTKGSTVKDKSMDQIDWENMTEAQFDKLYKTNRKLVEAYLRKPNF
jgi:hypothetical protein